MIRPDAQHGVDRLLQRVAAQARVSTETLVHFGATAAGQSEEHLALREHIEQIERLDGSQRMMERHQRNAGGKPRALELAGDVCAEQMRVAVRVVVVEVVLGQVDRGETGLIGLYGLVHHRVDVGDVFFLAAGLWRQVQAEVHSLLRGMSY